MSVLEEGGGGAERSEVVVEAGNAKAFIETFPTRELAELTQAREAMNSHRHTVSADLCAANELIDQLDPVTWTSRVQESYEDSDRRRNVQADYRQKQVELEKVLCKHMASGYHARKALRTLRSKLDAAIELAREINTASRAHPQSWLFEILQSNCYSANVVFHENIFYTEPGLRRHTACVLKHKPEERFDALHRIFKEMAKGLKRVEYLSTNEFFNTNKFATRDHSQFCSPSALKPNSWYEASSFMPQITKGIFNPIELNFEQLEEKFIEEPSLLTYLFNSTCELIETCKYLERQLEELKKCNGTVNERPNAFHLLDFAMSEVVDNESEREKKEKTGTMLNNQRTNRLHYQGARMQFYTALCAAGFAQHRLRVALQAATISLLPAIEEAINAEQLDKLKTKCDLNDSYDTLAVQSKISMFNCLTADDLLRKSSSWLNYICTNSTSDLSCGAGRKAMEKEFAFWLK